MRFMLLAKAILAQQSGGNRIFGGSIFPSLELPHFCPSTRPPLECVQMFPNDVFLRNWGTEEWSWKVLDFHPKGVFDFFGHRHHDEDDDERCDNQVAALTSFLIGWTMFPCTLFSFWKESQ